MARVFRFVFVSTLCLMAAMAFERAWAHEFASLAAIAEELALRRLDTLCRKDPECPLHDTGVIAALGTVTARLRTHPVVGLDGRVLTDTVVRVEIGKLLSFELEWPRIVQWLAAALDEHFAPLLARDSILDATVFDAFTAVTCNDFGTRRPSEDYLAIDETVGAMTPNFRGHTAFPVANSVCIDLAVEAYLFDLAVPPAGTRCPAQPIHF